MRRIIITGFSGFVARHYLDYLKGTTEKDIEVLGLDIAEPLYDLDEYRSAGIEIDFKTANLMDSDLVNKLIVDFKPTEILHLAAFSSVTYSWEHPADCFSNNTKVFLSVVEAVRINDLKCRILSVGSSEIYGDVTEDMLPLKEDMPINPLSPYAIARQAQEQLARVFVERFGMDIILTRSFNHIGPRQDQRFVVPSFIARILEGRKHMAEVTLGQKDQPDGLPEVTIETGDTSIIRDFLDVRDVVRAYDMLLKSGKTGETYNIAGNHGISLKELIDQIGDIAGVKVVSNINPAYVRPTDNPRIVGSYDKIKTDIGWNPQIPLRQTLSDMIELM